MGSLVTDRLLLGEERAAVQLPAWFLATAAGWGPGCCPCEGGRFLRRPVGRGRPSARGGGETAAAGVWAHALGEGRACPWAWTAPRGPAPVLAASSRGEPPAPAGQRDLCHQQPYPQHRGLGETPLRV